MKDSQKLQKSFEDCKKAFSCFNFLSQPICILEPVSFEITFTNASFDNLFGKTTGMLGKTFIDLFSQEEQAEIRQILQQIDEGETIELEKAPVYNDYHFDKIKPYFSLYRTPSIQGNYIISEFCWVHPKYLESFATIVNDPLMAVTRSNIVQEYKTQLYSVVHELNNAFSVLISNRDILEIYLNRISENLSENHIKLEKKAKESLAESINILKDNKITLNILNELLETSQNFLQRESYKLQILDLKEIVGTITGVLKKSFQTQPEVSIAIPDDLKIYANHSHINILLKNIILNSFQACDGLEACKIRIVASQRDGYVVIVVNDTGVGMSEEVLSKIFEPYSTTKGKQGSLGLGLTICHDIVKNYKGSLNIQSSERKGTTIEIKLPIS